MRGDLLGFFAVVLFSINTHAIPSGVGRTEGFSRGCSPLAIDGCSSGHHRPRLNLPLRPTDASETSSESENIQLRGAVSALRGGGGLGKKLGGKNIGMLIILFSLIYLPRAMSGCKARIIPATAKSSAKIQRLGCGVSLMATNLTTLAGLALVLINSRQYDRHGRSKLKMRLTGASIIGLGMMLVIAHAGTFVSISFFFRS
jgi:hypothetical protein